MTPELQKCRSLALKKAFVLPKIQNNSPAYGLSIPNHNISEFTFLVDIFATGGIVDFTRLRN
jgi:hypothetical protein